MSTQIHLLDGLAQKKLLDTKQFTPLELTNYYIDRIKKYNPSLNAIVHTMFEEARAEAVKVNLSQSTVAGLPFLIKSLNAVRNQPYTNSSLLQKGIIATSSDSLVDKYEQAGLTIVGISNSPEFGLLPTTEPKLYGATKNPWQMDYSPGGSSGGAAAAVAAGLVPFAHASDGGGSIRIPASACGLFGLKPSRGLLPYSPYINHYSISHALTRSVRDSAALLDIIVNKQNNQLYPIHKTDETFLSQLQHKPKKLRIGVKYDHPSLRFDEETITNYKQTVLLLERLGHEVIEVMPSIDMEQLASHFIHIWMATSAVAIKHSGQLAQQSITKSNVEELTYDILTFAEHLSAVDYENSRVYVHKAAQQFLQFFTDIDIWMTPTLNQLPKKIGATEAYNGDPYETMLRNMLDYNPYMPIANATGQPAMSIPTSFASNGLPIGTHFFGKQGEDGILLQLARQIEEAQPWNTYYTTIFNEN